MTDQVMDKVNLCEIISTVVVKMTTKEVETFNIAGLLFLRFCFALEK